MSDLYDADLDGPFAPPPVPSARREEEPPEALDHRGPTRTFGVGFGLLVAFSVAARVLSHIGGSPRPQRPLPPVIAPPSLKPLNGPLAPIANGSPETSGDPENAGTILQAGSPAPLFRSDFELLASLGRNRGLRRPESGEEPRITLDAGTRVTIVVSDGRAVLVRVEDGPFRNRTGWVIRESISAPILNLEPADPDASRAGIRDR